MNPKPHPEDPKGPPRSHRFVRGKPKLSLQPHRHRYCPPRLHGVRKLSDVLHQVLLEIAQGGQS